MELAVASQSVTVSANVGTSSNIADNEPVSAIEPYCWEL
jgi:hypothetical protein